MKFFLCFYLILSLLYICNSKLESGVCYMLVTHSCTVKYSGILVMYAKYVCHCHPGIDYTTFHLPFNL